MSGSVPVEPQPSQPDYAFKLHYMNARSVCNKTDELREYLRDSEADALAFTETWLRGDARDDVIIKELTPEGYLCEHVPRNDRGGGGVALLHKAAIHCKRVQTRTYASFEHMECVLGTSPPLRVVVLYRPPSSSTHYISFTDFMNDLDAYFQQLVVSSGRLLIIGDFNIDVGDESQDQRKANYSDFLQSLNLEQHVTESTHASGHTLDHVITPAPQDPPNITVDPLHSLSDHFLVCCSLQLQIPKAKSRQISYRAFKKIKPADFSADVSRALSLDSTGSSDDMIQMYDTTIASLIDKHAPLKVATVPLRDSSEW
jgi:exonuclease III